MAASNETQSQLPIPRERRKRSCPPIDVDSQLSPPKRLRFAQAGQSLLGDMNHQIRPDCGSLDAQKWFEDSNNDAFTTDNANFVGSKQTPLSANKMES